MVTSSVQKCGNILLPEGEVGFDSVNEMMPEEDYWKLKPKLIHA